MKISLIPLFILFLPLMAISQIKQDAIVDSHAHAHGVVCYAGISNHGLVIPPPPSNRNNQQNNLSFEVTFSASVPNVARIAFDRATNILGDLFSSPLPISVLVTFDELEPGSLAGAFPGTFLQDFQNAPLVDTWYPIALAEKIAIREFNSPNVPFDIQVVVNQDINWFYGTNGIAPNQFDFVTVIMHELLHGMGFSSLADLNGSQGTMLSQGFPTSYNRFIENGQAMQLVGDFVDPSIELGNQLTSNDLFLNTPTLEIANRAAKIHAPTNFTNGSSISHLDSRTFFGTVNSLMTPSIGAGAIIHNPGIALDILNDMGWSFTNILHEPGTGEEDVSQPYLVNATIISDNGFQENSIELHFSQDTFRTETIIPMLPNGQPNEYEALIPAPGVITKYQYYITLTDNENRIFVSPSEAPTPLFYEFFYDNDDTEPEIVHEAINTLDDQASSLDIDASVTDFFTGISQVFIDVRINGVEQNSVLMERDFSDGFRPDLYVGRIPLPDNGLSENDLLEYRIRAIDKSPRENIRTDPVNGSFYSITITRTLDAIRQYVNDFEVDENDFNGQGFSITQPNGFTDQAIHSIHPYTNAGQNNTRNFVYNLRLPIIIRQVEPLIEFEEIVLVEPGEPNTTFTDTEFWDFVIVEGRQTNSTNWLPFLDGYDSRADPTWLTTYNSNIVQQNSRAVGSPRLFRDRTIDMLENGNFVAGDTVLVRFRLFSDPFAVGWGWAIDNLRIQDSPVSTEDFIEEGDLKIFPNPIGNQLLNIDAQFKKVVNEVELRLLDIHGRTISYQSFTPNSKAFREILSVSNLPKGIFLISLNLDGEGTILKRIVKY